MLDSLKDMYISYPFMPVANRPEWFTHIKDIRCVVELPAGNPISEYRNTNVFRAWLTKQGGGLRIRVICSTYGYDQLLELPVYVWTENAPSTNSYILVDSEFDINQIGGAELQPDTLLFMQAAPKVTVEGSTSGVSVVPGYNVSTSTTNNGIMLFGAAGAGLGLAPLSIYAESPLSPARLGKGARSINGLDGSVWIKGAYPVDIAPESMVITIDHKDVEAVEPEPETTEELEQE